MALLNGYGEKEFTRNRGHYIILILLAINKKVQNLSTDFAPKTDKRYNH